MEDCFEGFTVHFYLTIKVFIFHGVNFWAAHLLVLMKQEFDDGIMIRKLYSWVNLLRMVKEALRSKRVASYAIGSAKELEKRFL